MGRWYPVVPYETQQPLLPPCAGLGLVLLQHQPGAGCLLVQVNGMGQTGGIVVAAAPVGCACASGKGSPAGDHSNHIPWFTHCPDRCHGTTPFGHAFLAGGISEGSGSTASSRHALQRHPLKTRSGLPVTSPGGQQRQQWPVCAWVRLGSCQHHSQHTVQ